MNRSGWFVLLALAAVAALFFTLDPLGFFAPSSDDTSVDDGHAEDLEGAGLKGRGVQPEDAELEEYEGEPVGVRDLQLGPNLLRGSVTGEGTPLYLARVRIVLPPPANEAGVRTRKDGTWEVRGLPDGQHTLRAAANGYRSKTVLAQPVGTTVVEDQGVQAGTELEVAPIDLRARPGLTDAIAVKVTDEFGRPIARAKVLATTMRWDLHLTMGPETSGITGVSHSSGVTDEEGKVHLSRLPPEKYNVVVSAKGFTTSGRNQVIVASGSTRHLIFKLAPAQSISGRVVDGEGKPVAGATVMAFHLPSFLATLHCQSSKDGSFVLDGLRRGDHMVIAWEEELGSIMTQLKAPSVGVEVKLGGTGVVEGTVRWSDETPVTAARVRPYRAEPFGYVYSTTQRIDNPDGTFRFYLPEGAWKFRVLTDDGAFSEDGKANVKNGQTAQVEITMAASGVVRGSVVDANGDHVVGAEVYVKLGGFPPTKSREHYARTNEDGFFEISGLALESVNLHVGHPHHCNQVIKVEPKLAADAQEITVRMTGGARIEGTVTDSDGNGVAGEQVNLYVTPWELRTTFTTYCDDRGFYVFDAVAAGTWQLSTGPFEQGARGVTRSGVKVPGSGVIVENFETQAAKGSVSGVVRLGGKPVAGAAVSVYDDRGLGYLVSATTDESGKFSAEGLRPGTVSVNVQTSDGLSTIEYAKFADGATHLDVTIELGTASVRGRAVDGEGKALTTAWVYIESMGVEDEVVWAKIKAQMSIGQDGSFHASGLEAGPYRVRINSGSYAQYLSETFVLAEGASKDLGNLRMSAGTTLSGIVRDDAGVPIEDATISLTDAAGKPVFLFSMSTTGSDGRYDLQGMEPGTYTVRFDASGHARDEKEITLGTEGATLDGVLTRGGAIAVQVEDESGHPIAGAKMTLYDAAGNQVTKTYSLANIFDSDRSVTDAQGRARIEDLAAGTYRVRITLEGWTPVTDAPSVYIAPGGAGNARVTLQRP